MHHSGPKGEGIMRKRVKVTKRAAVVLGLMLSLACGTLFAQQERKVISNPAPGIPALAKQMLLSGVVKVNIVIGADGLVKNVQVLGGHPILVREVEETLKKWKYAPASTETKAQLEFKFDR